MVNQSLVTNPTIRLPAFDLPHRSWSTLNQDHGVKLEALALSYAVHCDMQIRTVLKTLPPHGRLVGRSLTALLTL